MSTLKFIGNSTFRGNSAAYGGAIYAISNTFITFTGSIIFGNNSAEYDGGGIIAEKSTLNFSGKSTFGTTQPHVLVEEFMHCTLT